MKWPWDRLISIIGICGQKTRPVPTHWPHVHKLKILMIMKWFCELSMIMLHWTHWCVKLKLGNRYICSEYVISYHYFFHKSAKQCWRQLIGNSAMLIELRWSWWMCHLLPWYPLKSMATLFTLIYHSFTTYIRHNHEHSYTTNWNLSAYHRCCLKK